MLSHVHIQVMSYYGVHRPGFFGTVDILQAQHACTFLCQYSMCRVQQTLHTLEVQVYSRRVETMYSLINHPQPVRHIKFLKTVALLPRSKLSVSLLQSFWFQLIPRIQYEYGQSFIQFVKGAFQDDWDAAHHQSFPCSVGIRAIPCW